jgi:hypothetical protein
MTPRMKSATITVAPNHTMKLGADAMISGVGLPSI